MGGVPLLPQELARADERSGMFKLPADDICPLVEQQRQVAMRLDPLCVGWIHDRLAGRPNRNRFLELSLPRFRNPRDLRSEPLDVVSLFVESLLAHKQGEAGVLHPYGFNLSIERGLNLLPDLEGPWPQNIASRHVVIFYHFGFYYHLLVPFRKVVFFLELQF